jgi:hypothetical protein
VEAHEWCDEVEREEQLQLLWVGRGQHDHVCHTQLRLMGEAGSRYPVVKEGC